MSLFEKTLLVVQAACLFGMGGAFEGSAGDLKKRLMYSAAALLALASIILTLAMA